MKTFLKEQVNCSEKWPRDPPAKIMLKADNGKFLYNHSTKNTRLSFCQNDPKDEFRERCKFSLELMYPICPTIKGVTPREFFKKILGNNQLKHCEPIATPYV